MYPYYMVGNPLGICPLPAIFDVIFMFGGYLFLGLLKEDDILIFLGCSCPHYIGVFHLLSFVGLGLWKDIV